MASASGDGDHLGGRPGEDAAAVVIQRAFPAPVHLKHIDVPAEVSAPFTDQAVGYTDCAEISLLRWVPWPHGTASASGRAVRSRPVPMWCWLP